MATAAKPRFPGYAAPDEWPGVRLTLHKLYIEEDKSLGDVIAIMERDHGFRATYVTEPLHSHTLLMSTQQKDVRPALQEMGLP
jgi:hypothetical protein